MVRQFTARRLAESAATRPKKKRMPTAACPRSPMRSRVKYAAASRRVMPAPMPSRQDQGVAENDGTVVGGAAAGGASASGDSAGGAPGGAEAVSSAGALGFI